MQQFYLLCYSVFIFTTADSKSRRRFILHTGEKAKPTFNGPKLSIVQLTLYAFYQNRMNRLFLWQVTERERLLIELLTSPIHRSDTCIRKKAKHKQVSVHKSALEPKRNTHASFWIWAKKTKHTFLYIKDLTQGREGVGVLISRHSVVYSQIRISITAKTQAERNRERRKKPRECTD